MERSTLFAIGSCPRNDVWRVRFYYRLPDGMRDFSLPMWEVPATSWAHMQGIVAAFNKEA